MHARFRHKNTVLIIDIVKTNSIRCCVVLIVQHRSNEVGGHKKNDIDSPCGYQVRESIVDLDQDSSVHSLSSLFLEHTPPATSPPAIGPTRKDMDAEKRILKPANIKGNERRPKRKPCCRQHYLRINLKTRVTLNSLTSTWKGSNFYFGHTALAPVDI